MVRGHPAVANSGRSVIDAPSPQNTIQECPFRNRNSVRARRDEMRGAAYFAKRAFFPIDTFVDSLWGDKNFALVKRMAREGVPEMYHQDG